MLTTTRECQGDSTMLTGQSSTCDSNAGGLSLLVIPRGQLNVLAAAAGGLQQRVQVIRGVRAICETSRSQDGEGEAALL